MNGSSLLTSLDAPAVHGAHGDTIQLALIGCGGRGTGAVVDALSANNGPMKLVAMADVFANRLTSSHAALSAKFPAEVDVPEDQRFVGFDGYQKAMDCLKPGDIAIFATPPAFRWVHFDYAIEKGLNVFMEKPVTVDGPTTRRMFALADQSVREEPEGRRRPDVPALRCAARTAAAHAGRRNRRHRLDARLPHAAPRRERVRHAGPVACRK